MSSIADRLRALKKANYKETEPLTFPDGTQVVLSTLSAKEDRALSDYILPYMGMAVGHYAKMETLCHSIKWLKQVGEEEIDLRGLEHIETGEVLENGTPVRTAKNVFLRPILESWNDIVIDAVFMRYAQLVEQMEEDVSKNIRVEMTSDVLLAKIESKADELRNLVERAVAQGLSPKTAYDFTVVPLGEEGADKLLQALKKTGTQVPPPAPAPPPVEKKAAPPPATRYDTPRVAEEEEEAPVNVRR